MNNNIHIVEIDDISMRFNVASEKIDSIKEYLIKIATRKLFYEEFMVLNNITFKVERGEVFGIIGLNGAGKSTLLKIIAGVMKPTEGKVKTKGSIAPLIELGAGFDLNLSARENIFLNGAILGYSKRYLKDKFSQIVDFSELNDFLDMPIKNYSSGMIARLGFAVAAITEPDILIIDEILSVGDYKFQNKCEAKIESLLKQKTTIILVSHATDQVEKMCDKVLWLEKGEVKMLGKAENVCKAYLAN